jgi:osmoprotectant transport system substrate-binding protein
MAAGLGACAADEESVVPSHALDDDAITIASFDFVESELLATVYAEVLRDHGYEVELELGVAPRELLLPALAEGIVEMVPEYAGTALQFVSVGTAQPASDPGVTHDALVDALAVDARIVAFDPSPAQDANAIVVTEETALRHGLRTISDLRAVAGELTFAGPPECPSRPFCLGGLQSHYGLDFGEFLPLDAGGPMTRAALREGHADVALLFSTDSTIGRGSFVELEDDLHLQPAENVTPLVHHSVADRWGDELREVVRDVSRRISTEELRGLNLRVASGSTVDEAVESWLRSEGLA